MKDTDWELMYELYKNPNMTKVADLLYITQPSLSKRLQHIEAEFDVTIVERTPKGLAFTPEGAFLAKQAEAYLNFMRQTKQRLAEMQENAASLITIGSSYTYSKYTLTDQLIRYREKHPSAAFSVQIAPSNQLFRRVLDGTIDVAFIRSDYEGAANRVFLGKNKAYAMTRDPIESLDQLKGMKRLWYSSNAESLSVLDQWWEDWYGEKAPNGQVLGYVDVVWQMVSKGMGYALCFLPEEFTNPLGLYLTPLTDRSGNNVCRNTWMLYSKNKRLSDTVQNFVRFMEREAAKTRGTSD